MPFKKMFLQTRKDKEQTDGHQRGGEWGRGDIGEGD